MSRRSDDLVQALDQCDIVIHLHGLSLSSLCLCLLELISLSLLCGQLCIGSTIEGVQQEDLVELGEAATCASAAEIVEPLVRLRSLTT